MLKKLVIAGLIAVSFALWRPWGLDGLLPPKEIAFQLFSILIICSFLVKNKPLSKVGLGVLGLIPLLGVQSIALTGPAPIPVKICSNLILGIFVLWILANQFKLTDFDDLLKAIATIGFVQAAYGISQAIYDPIFNAMDLFNREGYVPTVHDRVFGLFGSPSHFALFLCLCLPACFFLRGKIIRWLFPLTILTAIFITQRSTAMAVLTGYLFYGMWRVKQITFQGSTMNTRKSLAWIAPLVMLILMTAGMRHEDNYNLDYGKRPEVWAKTIDLGMNTPIFGKGFGVFGERTTIFTLEDGGYKTKWIHPHNEFVALWFSSGITGLLILLGIIVWFIHRLISQWTYSLLAFKERWTKHMDVALCGLFAIAMYSLTSYPFYVATSAMLAIVYCALFLVATDSAWKSSIVSMDMHFENKLNQVAEVLNVA